MDLKIKLGLNKGIQTGTTQIAKKGVSAFSISGVVYDADGTTPVSGATIALGALSTTSAANGTYTISNVPANTSGSMTCTLAGYSWSAITIAAMSGNLTTQNFVNVWYAASGVLASCVAAYQPKGAVGYAASKVNLANPGTYDCVNGLAFPTWLASTGWTFDKTLTQYLDTGITGITKNYTIIVQFSNGFTPNNGRLFGADENVVLHVYPALGGHYYRLFGDSGAITGDVTNGNLCVTNGNAYLNGTSDATFTSGAGSTVNSLYIGASNSLSVSPFSGNILAFAIYSTSLNGTQVAALAAAMAALP